MASLKAPRCATTASTTGREGRMRAGLSVTIQFCGDAITEGTEQCDDGTNDGTGLLGLSPRLSLAGVLWR